MAGVRIERVVVFGAGGCARDIADILDACGAVSAGVRFEGFLVDPAYGKAGDEVHGRPIVGDESWFRRRAGQVKLICGVGNPRHRETIVRRFDVMGASWCNAVHPRAIVPPGVRLGQGVTIGAGTVLTCDICIGNHVQVNSGCTLNHDVVLDDYVTVSPGVHLAGNVTVGRGAFIGIGTNVIERRNVGEWSITGAGSAIIDDVPARATVVGVPGRVISTGDLS